MTQGPESITLADHTTAPPGPALGYTTLDQERLIDDLPVTGTLPTWLTGTLVRNGPAKFEAGNKPVAHWFDGLAMLHRFSVREGRVSYANHFLRTKAYRAAQEGRLAYREFATDPCRSIFRRMMSVFDPQLTDNALVSVTRIGDAYLALTETPLPVRFDPRTLETLGFEPGAPGQATTAHPHRDPDSGDLINYATYFGPRTKYRVYRQGRALNGASAGLTRPRVIARLAAPRPAYMHSFAMSERYLALTEFPFVVNPLQLGFGSRPFIANFRWQPQRGTRIHVLDRHTGTKVGTFEGPPAFAFHHLAAWEEGDGLVIDFCDHGDASVIDRLYLRRLRGEEPPPAAPRPGSRSGPRLTRWRVNLTRGTVDDEVLSDAALELPRLNESRCYLRRYRFAFGIGAVSPDSTISDQLVKIDTEAGEAVEWHEHGCYPGEPVFVPAPDGGSEDDGVALSVVLDARAQRSFLLVLDGGTFEERARAEVPHHIPFGFHGGFYPSPEVNL